MTNTEWQIAAQEYLARLGMAEWNAQGRPIPSKRSMMRFYPSQYMRDLVDLLGKNDEEGFKARKMLEGYGSKAGV